jgi:hypothetical protein
VKIKLLAVTLGLLPLVAMVQTPTGAASASPVQAAAVTPPSLDGEVFQSTAFSVNQGTGCGLQQLGSPRFTASGTASGPLPGTFTESGGWDFDLMQIQTIDTQFTIHSGGKTYTGVVLYDVTSTGADGKSIIQNLAGCAWADGGGAYSICQSQSLGGACGGQSVFTADATSAAGFSQRFYHLVGPYHLAVVSGDGQSAQANGFALAPLTVQVLDANNQPAWGRAVVFHGNGKFVSILFPTSYSGADGTAAVNATTSYTVGSYQVKATISGSSAVFHLTNTP